MKITKRQLGPSESIGEQVEYTWKVVMSGRYHTPYPKMSYHNSAGRVGPFDYHFDSVEEARKALFRWDVIHVAREEEWVLCKKVYYPVDLEY